jgi:quinoprotein glucose dehydrogenase
MTPFPLKHAAFKDSWLSSKMAAAISLAAVATSLFGADIAGPASKNSQLKPYPRSPQPESVPASSETENRSRQFNVPAGMKVDLWAAEPMLANAVAFCLDEKGRVFVAETHRYRTSVLDMRHYMFMLEDDLACRTIEDRSAMVKKHFPTNWTDLAIESEVVRLLEDRSGSGKADFSSIYADGFNTELDGIASGVLARKGRVWLTSIPELRLLEGIDAKGRAVSQKTVSRGYGVRFSITGHDMHGLVIGPDGRLYFSFGDRAANVVTKEGRRLEFPDEGGVFRCELDGSNLEAFAHGLRNPQELAFNEYGDLFTGENDSDQGDRERWVYLVEGSDSGWRVGYQNAPLGNAGPWNMERLWVPSFEGQAAYILPPLANIADGPSGLFHNPGTGLSPQLDGRFFLAYFKGTSASSGVSSIATKRDGAGYVLTAHDDFIANALITDVDIGPDGSVYFSDWGEGWERTKRSRIFRLTDTEAAKQPIVAETKHLIAQGFETTPTTHLVALLEHQDMRVRQEAQFELAARGSEGLLLLKQVALRGQNPLARRHAIWGLGQIGRKGTNAIINPTKDIADPLTRLLVDPDAEIRAQVLRTLADGSRSTDLAPVINAMADTSPRVRSFAAQAVAKLAGPEACEGIIQLLRQNNGNDRVLQHVGALALAKSASVDQRVAASKDVSPAVRKAIAVAFRMRGESEIAPMLQDSDPLVVLEAARAINDLPIVGARPALAALGNSAALSGLIKSFGALPQTYMPKGTAAAIRDIREGQPMPWANAPVDQLTPMLLRVVNANFRSGLTADAERLAAIALRGDVSDLIRTEALFALANWAKPHQRDRIVGIYRPLDGRGLVDAQKALASIIPALLKQQNEAVQIAAAAAISRLKMIESGPELKAALSSLKNPPKARAAMLGALGELHSPLLSQAIREVEKDETAEVRKEAGRWLASINKGEALASLEKTIETAPIGEKQAAFVNLGAIQDPGADAFIARWLGKLTAGEALKELGLEIVQAATGREANNVKTALADYQAKKDTGTVAKFQESLFGGNAENGRKIFFEKVEASCLRCHKVKGEGGEAGPELTGIASKRDRAYFLESIVTPNASIAPGFESVLITQKNGRQVAGIVRSETVGELTILSPEDGMVTVNKADVRAREKGLSGMPEGLADAIGARDLRDVVEYLSTLK